MRGFFQVEDLTQDEDIDGPVLDRKMEVHRLTHNQWQRLRPCSPYEPIYH